MRTLSLMGILLFLLPGCGSRTETVQQWHGQVGDQPVQLSMKEMSKTESGPDIQGLIKVGIEAAKGDIIGATTSLLEEKHSGFDAQMQAMNAQIGEASAYGAGDAARDGGLLAVLMPLLMQFLRQRKQDKRMDELDRDRVELAKKLPPE